MCRLGRCLLTVDCALFLKRRWTSLLYKLFFMKYFIDPFCLHSRGQLLNVKDDVDLSKTPRFRSALFHFFPLLPTGISLGRVTINGSDSGVHYFFPVSSARLPLGLTFLIYQFQGFASAKTGPANLYTPALFYFRFWTH